MISGARELMTPGAWKKDEGLTYLAYSDVDPNDMNDEDHKVMQERQKKLITPVTGARDQTEEFLQRTALNARVYADQIRKTASNVQNKATYPQSRLAADLKLVAQMIASGMPTRVYYVTLGGFDTHAGERGRHDQLMQQLAEAFANERSKLEQQWDRGDNISTEDLRMAFQRYRSFFRRLLSM